MMRDPSALNYKCSDPRYSEVFNCYFDLDNQQRRANIR